MLRRSLAPIYLTSRSQIRLLSMSQAKQQAPKEDLPFGWCVRASKLSPHSHTELTRAAVDPIHREISDKIVPEIAKSFDVWTVFSPASGASPALPAERGAS